MLQAIAAIAAITIMGEILTSSITEITNSYPIMVNGWETTWQSLVQQGQDGILWPVIEMPAKLIGIAVNSIYVLIPNNSVAILIASIIITIISFKIYGLIVSGS